MQLAVPLDGSVLTLLITGVVLVLLPGITKFAVLAVSAETRIPIGPRTTWMLVTLGVLALFAGVGVLGVRLITGALAPGSAAAAGVAPATSPPAPFEDTTPSAGSPVPQKSDLLPGLGIGRAIDCPTAKQAPVRFGDPDPFGPTNGLDLDCARVTTAETEPGADLSGQRAGDVINLVSEHARAAKVYNLVRPDDFQRCLDVDPAEWTDTLNGLGGLTPTDGLCVRTSEGNLAIVTFDRPYTSAQLDVRYWIQYRR